jgi:hypothetical protein
MINVQLFSVLYNVLSKVSQNNARMFKKQLSDIQQH